MALGIPDLKGSMEEKTKYALGAVAAAVLTGTGVWLGSIFGRREVLRALSPFEFGNMKQGHVWYIRKDGERLIILDEPAIWHLKDSRPVQGVTFPIDGKPEWHFDWLLEDGKTTSRIVFSPVVPPPSEAIGRAYAVSFPGRQAAKAAHAFVYTLDDLELNNRIIDMSIDRDGPRGGAQ